MIPMQRPPFVGPVTLGVGGVAVASVGGLAKRRPKDRWWPPSALSAPTRRRRKWSFWPALVVLSPVVAIAVGTSVRWASLRYLSRFGLPPAGLASDPTTILLTPGTAALTAATLVLGAVVARNGGVVRVSVALVGAVLLGCGTVTQLAIRQADEVQRGTPVDRPSFLPFGLLARRFQVVFHDGSPSPVSDRALYLGLADGDYVIWEPANRAVVRIPFDRAALFSVSTDSHKTPSSSSPTPPPSSVVPSRAPPPAHPTPR